MLFILMLIIGPEPGPFREQFINFEESINAYSMLERNAKPKRNKRKATKKIYKKSLPKKHKPTTQIKTVCIYDKTKWKQKILYYNAKTFIENIK